MTESQFGVEAKPVSRVHIVLWPTAACARCWTLEGEAQPEDSELHRPFFRTLQELLSVRGRNVQLWFQLPVVSTVPVSDLRLFVNLWLNLWPDLRTLLTIKKKIQQSRHGDLVALTTTLLFANVPETLLIAGSSAAQANKNEFSWKLIIGPSLRPLLLTLRRRSDVLRDVGLVSMCDMMSDSTSVSADTEQLHLGLETKCLPSSLHLWWS